MKLLSRTSYPRNQSIATDKSASLHAGNDCCIFRSILPSMKPRPNLDCWAMKNRAEKEESR